MTPQDHKPSPEETREVLRDMQVRMRNYALYHTGTIGQRTLVELQRLDLYDEPIDEHLGANVDTDVLRDPAHARRVPLPPGPLLVYVLSDDRSKRMVAEIPILLLSDLGEVRRSALGELERMVAAGALEITPRTGAALEKNRAGVLSDNPHDWRPAAVDLADALDDDIFLTLQGVRQCLECQPAIQDKLNKFAPRVLRPYVSSLDSIRLDVGDPASEHAKLTEVVVESTGKAPRLRDACALYYAHLGYLPLAPAYSMAEVVLRWLKAHPSTDSWSEVWAWADSTRGPIPRYHACTVFILRPDLIPDGKKVELWSKMLVILQGLGGREADGVTHEPWALRQDLARHFSHHLEAQLPDNDGAKIACFAWWYAERVASLFPDKPESARFYRNEWVAAARELSAHVWLAASPHIGRSYLRYVTAAVPSPWATALLALMAGKLPLLGAAELPAETQSLFQDALASCLIGSLPFVVEPVADPTYAHECALGQTALDWAATQAEEQRKALEQLVSTSRILGSVDGLCEGLRKLDERSIPDQIAVTISLKAKAYTDPTIGAAIWDVLSDAEWRQRVLAKVENQILAMLVEAFCLVQADSRDKWFWNLPHFLAELCEKTEDKDRARQLFLCVVLASLGSDTVSAVRRLLIGSRKELMIGFAAEYRTRVLAYWPQYPGWVQGRLRALLASFDV